jgi:SAM-dependent methyltransferase
LTLTLRTEIVSACPLCGGVEISPLLLGFDLDRGTGDYRIDRCRTCGMPFTNPQVIAADVPLLYEDRTYDDLPNGTSPLGWLRAARVHARLRKLGPLLPEGPLLCADIGTGDGFFAAELSRMPICSGVTASDFFPTAPPAIRAAERATYVEYEQFFLQDQTYDVIFARFVLEHVRAPVTFVEDASRKLRPGGALIIDVPNWRGIWRRIFGRYYSELGLPAHVNHFDPDTLRRLLAGFDLHIFEDLHGLVLGRSVGNVLGSSRARTGAAALALGGIEILLDTFPGPASCMTAVARKHGVRAHATCPLQATQSG